jgi:hypothetical protein
MSPMPWAASTTSPGSSHLARQRHTGAGRRRAGDRPCAGRRPRARLRFLCLFRPQVLRPDGHRRALRQARTPRGDAAVAGGGDMVRSVSFDANRVHAHPAPIRGGNSRHCRRDRPRRRVGFRLGDRLGCIGAHERSLLDRARAGIERIPGVRIVGTARHKAGILSFVIDGVHPHDIGSILDRDGIAVRTGHHCAMPAMQHFDPAERNRAGLVRLLQHAGEGRSVRGGRAPGAEICFDDPKVERSLSGVVLEHCKRPRNFRTCRRMRTTGLRRQPACAAITSTSICAGTGCDPRHRLRRASAARSPRRRRR